MTVQLVQRLPTLYVCLCCHAYLDTHCCLVLCICYCGDCAISITVIFPCLCPFRGTYVRAICNISVSRKMKFESHNYKDRKLAAEKIVKDSDRLYQLFKKLQKEGEPVRLQPESLPPLYSRWSWHASTHFLLMSRVCVSMYHVSLYSPLRKT